VGVALFCKNEILVRRAKLHTKDAAVQILAHTVGLDIALKLISIAEARLNTKQSKMDDSITF
jgi:hypothetical protein